MFDESNQYQELIIELNIRGRLNEIFHKTFNETFNEITFAFTLVETFSIVETLVLESLNINSP